MLLPDGTVCQSNFNQYLSRNKYMFPQEGVVWKTHYQEDQDNLMEQGIEYSVILGTREITRARSMFSRGGYENGLNRVLRETTKTIDGSALDSETTPLEVMDGDHVLVVSAYGNENFSYIVGILPHPRREDSDDIKREDGNKIEFKHQDTTVVFDKDGTLSVDREDGTYLVDIDLLNKKVKIDIDGTTFEVGNGEVATKKAGVAETLAKSTLNQTLAFLLSTQLPLLNTLSTTSIDPATKIYAASMATAITITLTGMGYVFGSDFGLTGPVIPLPTGPATKPGTLITSILKAE